MVSIGLNFFPVDLWVMTLGSVIFWITLNIIVGLYMFILDLIPIVR